MSITLYGYKNGARSIVGAKFVNKDILRDGTATVSEVFLAPKDPSDPTGQLRLNVAQEAKEHFYVIKWYLRNPPQVLNEKLGVMEDKPYHSSWIPAAIADAEFRYYSQETGNKMTI